MSKHTPGPWVVGERIKSARLDDAIMIRPADHRNYEYGATAIISTSEADAHLIAAAPDLLEFAKAVVCYSGSAGDHYLSKKARDVINRATGKNK